MFRDKIALTYTKCMILLWYLPVCSRAVSSVQSLRNFGCKMSAATNSGCRKTSAKRRAIPASSTSISGVQICSRVDAFNYLSSAIWKDSHTTSRCVDNHTDSRNILRSWSTSLFPTHMQKSEGNCLL